MSCFFKNIVTENPAVIYCDEAENFLRERGELYHEQRYRIAIIAGEGSEYVFRQCINLCYTERLANAVVQAWLALTMPYHIIRALLKDIVGECRTDYLLSGKYTDAEVCAL